MMDFDSELQDLEEWGDSIDFDCLDAIEALQSEPLAKRLRTSEDFEPDQAQGEI